MNAKKSLAMVLALLLAACLSACGSTAAQKEKTTDTPTVRGYAVGNRNSDDRDNATPANSVPSAGANAAQGDSVPGVKQASDKRRDEALRKLRNYKITVKGSQPGSEEEILLAEIHWQDGHASQWAAGQMTYYDYKNRKVYTLNADDKSGTASAMEPNKIGEQFGGMLGEWMFGYANREGLRKLGSEKILGRGAAIYEFREKTEGGEYVWKVWVDEEYGLALKSAVSIEGNVAGVQAETEFEVTEFRVGGVSLEDMPDLEAYEIKESAWPSSPFGQGIPIQ